MNYVKEGLYYCVILNHYMDINDTKTILDFDVLFTDKYDEMKLKPAIVRYVFTQNSRTFTLSELKFLDSKININSTYEEINKIAENYHNKAALLLSYVNKRNNFQKQILKNISSINC